MLDRIGRTPIRDNIGGEGNWNTMFADNILRYRESVWYLIGEYSPPGRPRRSLNSLNVTRTGAHKTASAIGLYCYTSSAMFFRAVFPLARNTVPVRNDSAVWATGDGPVLHKP